MDKPKPRKDLLAHCGELRDDDGVDPREYFKKPANESSRRRKTYQLCSQVADALRMVLSSEFDDDRLLHLHVVAVEPAPDAANMLVTLQYDGPSEVDRSQVLQRLEEVSGVLRSEVAASITRKRAPRLRFRLLADAG